MPSKLQQARADETRSRLLDAGRALFTERGFADTSTEELVQRAGVTRGALYHHFDSKQLLFEAVFLQLEDEFAEAAARVVASGGSAWDNVVAGCRAFLDMALRADVQRIMLLDGPAVLGSERWRAIEGDYALAALLAGLTGAMDDGVVARHPALPLARMLLAAVHEAGVVIAQAEDAAVARAEVGASLDALLDGLRTRA